MGCAWQPCRAGALPGFGELEEYFLPREIGEITGQARVPFGSSEQLTELHIVTLLDPVGFNGFSTE